MTATFAVTFPFISRAHVSVLVNDVAATFSWLHDGAITLTSIPTAGATVRVQRTTPSGELVRWDDVSNIRERDMNLLRDQLIYYAQETADLYAELQQRTLRRPSREYGLNMLLPEASLRANKVLAFGGSGEISMISGLDRSSDGVTPEGGSTSRLLASILGNRADPRNHGGIGSGTADDTAALQAAATVAAARGIPLYIPYGTWRITTTVSVASTVSVTMDGEILYDGPQDCPALVLGESGSTRAQAQTYRGIRVTAATQSAWTNDDFVGVRLNNIDACKVEIVRVEKFTIGVQLLSDGVGCEDSDIQLGRIVDCRYGLDLRTLQAASWVNSLRFYGGHFANSSATNTTTARYGVRYSCASGAYNRHNAHSFFGPAFELQRGDGVTYPVREAIPFLFDAGDERGVHAHDVRMEACSPYVAKVTGGPNDCSFAVSYTGTYAFTGNAVLYTSTATRAGLTVLPKHQAMAAHGAPRLVAAAENVRQRAFRQTIDVTDGVGFEQMAVLSANPSGPPTNLTGFAFAGLTLFTLNADTVGIPTSRAVGFVLDCSLCKEFFLAAEGSELRPVVMQFDASENVLDSTSPVLFSNMNTVWGGSPSYFWEGNADLDSLSGGLALNRLQRVTIHDNAKICFIGVRGGSATAILRALRIYTPALFSPAVLFGGSRKWGVREYTWSFAYDPPSLASAAVDTQNWTCTGFRPGDSVTAGFTTATTLPLTWVPTGTNTIRTLLTNNTGAAVDVNAGTLFIRAVKPKL
ncbi:phage tail fiber protein [Roseomonas sp. GC11]|nr:phage tail fiber protein [Roseomonas sp. GC11]